MAIKMFKQNFSVEAFLTKTWYTPNIPSLGFRQAEGKLFAIVGYLHQK